MFILRISISFVDMETQYEISDWFPRLNRIVADQYHFTSIPGRKLELVHARFFRNYVPSESFSTLVPFFGDFFLPYSIVEERVTWIIGKHIVIMQHSRGVLVKNGAPNIYVHLP